MLSPMEIIKSILKRLLKVFEKITCHGSKKTYTKKSTGKMTTKNNTGTSSYKTNVEITKVKIKQIRLQ